jgi:acyl-CoA reductase-like NAD-dependent aldehyde dehydrogenase
LYDPLGDYLRPQLQGYRLLQGEYERVPPGDQGQLVSEALNLELRLQGGQLQVVNPATGERLLTPAEAHAARRTEAEARQAAEAEVERLQEELARLRGRREHDR